MAELDLPGFEQPLLLTVEQAAACIASAYHDTPYVEACRLRVGAKICGDAASSRFWAEVAVRLGFDRPLP